jgi:hypothetical protein
MDQQSQDPVQKRNLICPGSTLSRVSIGSNGGRDMEKRRKKKMPEKT